MVSLNTPLNVSSAFTAKNRILKSAMSEQLGDRRHAPTPLIINLYRRWAQGGVGIAITGNVMIDRAALGEPLNIVLEDDRDLDKFRDLAKAGTKNNTLLLMQLNHPGKQSPIFLSSKPVAPSAVPLGAGLESAFAKPRALEIDEIDAIISKFAYSARLAKLAGFSGIQIHAAHGYLVSQFLSPHHNRRTDRYGGSLENRQRFLLEVYRAIREATGHDFLISVKLNSADFQKGGFNETDSLGVLKALDKAGVDIIEVSGGNYETPAMVGIKSSTKKREAYFLEFAEKAKESIKTHLAVTGGFRSARAMNEALADGATDLIGIARPMAIDASLPEKFLKEGDFKIRLKRPTTGVKFIDKLSMLDITWYEYQIKRIAEGKEPSPDSSPWIAVLKTAISFGIVMFKKRRA